MDAKEFEEIYGIAPDRLGKYPQCASTESDYQYWMSELKQQMPCVIRLDHVAIRGGIQRAGWKKETWLTRVLVKLAYWILRKDNLVVIRYKDE